MIDDSGLWYQRGHRLLRVTLLAVTLAGCSWAANGTYNAAQPELTVQGDYQPLAACVRSGLAGQERDVSVAVDRSDRRARVWRQLPYQTIGADEFDVDLWQMAPREVGIATNTAGIDVAHRSFLARLAPIVEDCAERVTPRAEAAGSESRR